MYDQQNCSRTNRAKSDETLPFLIVHGIALCEGVRIIKHQCGGLEAYAVFAPVLPVLFFVPFKAYACRPN